MIETLDAVGCVLKLQAVDAPGPVLMPGDPERAATIRNTAEGVPLHYNIAATLVRLGETLGIDRPSTFAGVQAGTMWSEKK
eukprot:m.253237 g.253237  ORF g.253237 m.253237 type:complete len:81 (-) comp19580_c0_seq4:377-619(-)